MLWRSARAGLVALCLASSAMAGEPCNDLLGHGTIAVFSSQAVNSQCIVVSETPAPFTFYIYAVLDGATATGLAGAEFRVEVTPSLSGLFFNATPNPSSNVSLGTPLVAVGDQGGANIAFPACQGGQAGDAVLLYTVSGFNTTPGPLDFRVKSHTSPSSPNFNCPQIVLCNAPIFTKVCLTPTEENLGREPVASMSLLRTSSAGCNHPCFGPPGPSAPLGVYADSLGTQPDLCVQPSVPKTFYLVGLVPQATPPGVTGAEFRVEFSNPSGYFISYLAPQGAQVVGSPLDLTPQDPNDPAGATVLFPGCVPSTPQPGDLVQLGQLTIVDFGGGPTDIRIRRKQPPGDPGMLCPRFFLCDEPFRTPVCMVPGTDIVFQTTLGGGNCVLPPFDPESLQLNTHDPANDGTAGPVSTLQVLPPGTTFLVTVTGTASLTNANSWIAPPSVLCGVPEQAPQTPSVGVTNHWVGSDAEVQFAAALPSGGICSTQGQLGHHARFEIDLGSGFTHLEPMGGPEGSPAPGHRYRYLVQGTNAHARFRWVELTTSDNYGVLTITIDDVNPTSVPDGSTAVPRASAVQLLPNVPDPFNPTTTISWVLPAATHAQVEIFDVRGRRIRALLAESQPAGLRSTTWNGRDDAGHAVPSGSYVVRLSTPLGAAVERLTLIR